MKIDDIILSYINKDKYNRKLGRYWATDIYSIKKGYTTPENFFKSNDIGIDGCKMILTGKANEEILTKLFKKMKVDFIPQDKKEIKINKEIILVVKPDFVFPDYIIETKYPFSMTKTKKIPERYYDQLEAEYRAYNKTVYLGLISSPFNVVLLEYTPSKRRWNNIQKLLIDFHDKLKQIEAVSKKT